MKPYYESDGIQLFHGDCLEITEWLAADVLVTDPPYGMAYRSNKRHQTERFDAIANDADPAIRDAVLKMWGSRPGILFGSWRVPKPAGVQVTCIWDKRTGSGVGMGNLDLPFGVTHEEFYLVGAPWSRLVTRRGSVVQTSTQMSGSSGLVSTVGHPTPKPVPLMEMLIGVTAGAIADPFAGSGSTLVAARNLGRKAIGVELEEKYCEIAARRLDQGVLFAGDAS